MSRLDQDWGDDGGLGPLLDAYADDRLRADPERTGRVRARVVAEARQVAERPEPREATAPRRRAVLPPAVTRPFRGLALLGVALLAALALAGGVLAGSAPGGPLYGARLWLEAATLPSDASARLDAELRRLEDRLHEATDAAASGNGDAVTAALEAYRATVDEAAAGAGVDADLRARLAAALGLHAAVLGALETQVPGRAADAIRAAVERAEDRIEQILATPPGKPVSPGGPAGPAATPRPTPKRTPPGKPEATPKPAVTREPAATPKPTKAPGPQRTPPGQADKTPKPAP